MTYTARKCKTTLTSHSDSRCPKTSWMMSYWKRKVRVGLTVHHRRNLWCRASGRRNRVCQTRMTLAGSGSTSMICTAWSSIRVITQAVATTTACARSRRIRRSLRQDGSSLMMTRSASSPTKRLSSKHKKLTCFSTEEPGATQSSKLRPKRWLQSSWLLYFKNQGPLSQRALNKTFLSLKEA